MDSGELGIPAGEGTKQREWSIISSTVFSSLQTGAGRERALFWLAENSCSCSTLAHLTGGRGPMIGTAFLGKGFLDLTKAGRRSPFWNQSAFSSIVNVPSRLSFNRQER